MANNSNGNTVLLKTRELCQVITELPEFKDTRRRIEAFQADAGVQAQFRHLSEIREKLERKQQEGGSISNAEITEFERVRDGFVGHPIASAFLKAQEELHEIRRQVNAYVTKTFETGGVVAPEEIENESCGHSCGCHDH